MTSFDNDFFKREKFQSSITVLFQGIQEEFWKSILDVFLNRHLYSIWPRDFQCLLLCTAMASIAKHYTFLWMWVNLYCQSFDPFFLSFPLFFPHFFFCSVFGIDPLSWPSVWYQKNSTLDLRDFFLTWGSIIILLKLIQTFVLVALEWTFYTGEKNIYYTSTYLFLKLETKLPEKRLWGSISHFVFCNYFMVFFSVNPTVYTYFAAKCQILTREGWNGQKCYIWPKGRKCDKNLNTEHLLLSCWSLVCSHWKQRSNNCFTFILNIWSC